MTFLCFFNRFFAFSTTEVLSSSAGLGWSDMETFKRTELRASPFLRNHPKLDPWMRNVGEQARQSQV